MIPIGETFNRFRRVVRDVSQELGKDIDLIISGAETELDKTVVEKIGDPLMHLLRNAMDHGIETAAARLAAGTPAKGHQNGRASCRERVSQRVDLGGQRNIKNKKKIQQAKKR